MYFSAVGRQRVLLDLERAGDLAIRAGERPRQVESPRVQLVEIGDRVEVAVEDRAVVLGGRDQDRGLAPEQEVMRIVGMQADRVAGGPDGRSGPIIRMQRRESATSRNTTIGRMSRLIVNHRQAERVNRQVIGVQPHAMPG